MIFDFEIQATSDPSRGDVCIVGAGGAGILLAVRLASAGHNVILLEGGGMHLESRSQDLYQSEIVGRPFTGVHTGRFRTHGGTTTEWGGQILELDDEDFSIRGHVAGSGWPFPKDELLPYYNEAIRAEGLSKSLPGGVDGRQRLLERMHLRDLPLGPDFALPFSRWCPRRNFADVYDQALRETPNLSVYLHANVVEILMNEDLTSITGLRLRTWGGRESVITADHFVLCMGGIESTRLLLQPTGQPVPWQANGMLGRHSQDHICCDRIPIGGFAFSPISRYFGCVASRGFQYQTKIQLAFSKQREHATLNVAGSIAPYLERDVDREQAARTIHGLRNGRGDVSNSVLLRSLRHVPGIVINWIVHHLFGGALAWRKTMLCVHSEQSPTTSSRITLSDERDGMGMLRTKIDWRISTQEIESIRTYVRLAKERFNETGFATIEPPAGFLTDDSVLLELCSDSNHHMGSTRMSIEASEGVVDPDLRLHGVQNGYVCSASVFPSCGFSNPSHTVFALAFRLADRLTRLRDAKVNHTT